MQRSQLIPGPIHSPLPGVAHRSAVDGATAMIWRHSRSVAVGHPDSERVPRVKESGATVLPCGHAHEISTGWVFSVGQTSLSWFARWSRSEQQQHGCCGPFDDGASIDPATVRSRSRASDLIRHGDPQGFCLDPCRLYHSSCRWYTVPVDDDTEDGVLHSATPTALRSRHGSAPRPRDLAAASHSGARAAASHGPVKPVGESIWGQGTSRRQRWPRLCRSAFWDASRSSNMGRLYHCGPVARSSNWSAPSRYIAVPASAVRNSWKGSGPTGTAIRLGTR